MAFVCYEQIGKQVVSTSEETTGNGSPPPYVVRGHKMPIGYGKLLYQRVPLGVIAESTDSMPPKPRRRPSPPPIQGSPGRMEFSDPSDDESGALWKAVKGLRQRVDKVEDQMGEGHLRREVLEDDMEWLRKGLGFEINRIATMAGHPDSYDIPRP